MPITINDCKCGLKPRIKAYCSCGYQSTICYYIECPREGCEMQTDLDFEVVVHDWNAANPRSKDANND